MTATSNIKNVPSLRFKEFKDKWEAKKLGEVSKISSGGTPSRTDKNYWNGDIPWISTALIDFNLILTADEYITLEGLTNSSAKLFPTGTILMAMYGQGKTRGKVAVLGIEATTNQACAAIISEKTINNNFLYQNLKGRYDEIRNLSNEGGQQNLSSGIIKEIEITFPTLPEQQKIAAFLSSVDEKIQQLTRKKELLEQYKKGVMQQLFSGKLRFKDENGKAFPKWEEKRLGEVCEVNPSSSELPDSFIYIDLESVDSGLLKIENRINKAEAPSRAQRKLLPNDILYQTVRPYQMNNLFFDKKGDYVASTGYAQLRAKESPMFLYQLLHSDNFVNDVMERCTGTSFPAINSKDLAKITIKLPHKEEQQKIATFLSNIDTKIENINNQITQAQSFKKGLLQQMFV